MNAPLVIMETCAGYGEIWKRCYFGVENGVAFDKNENKCRAIVKHRPGWAIYEGDAIGAIEGGVGKDMPINFLDVDPYGDPWLYIKAFFNSDRTRPNKIAIAVNDGLRLKARTGSAWHCESLRPMVIKYGNNMIHNNYLEICQEMIQKEAAQCRYTLIRWAGYYCGHNQQMTHYGGIFTRE